MADFREQITNFHKCVTFKLWVLDWYKHVCFQLMTSARRRRTCVMPTQTVSTCWLAISVPVIPGTRAMGGPVLVCKHKQIPVCKQSNTKQQQQNSLHTYIHTYHAYMVVRAFAHGAMGRRIDPSGSGPIELFLVQASAPRLV